jgi:hypothetical protein
MWAGLATVGTERNCPSGDIGCIVNTVPDFIAAEHSGDSRHMCHGKSTYCDVRYVLPYVAALFSQKQKNVKNENSDILSVLVKHSNHFWLE